MPDDAEAWVAAHGVCHALQLTDPHNRTRRLAAVDGHVDWIEPLAPPAADPTR